MTSDRGPLVRRPTVSRSSQVDTVVVAAHLPASEVPEAVLGALRAAHARGSRILSLCGGAFVLAEAGMLDGRRAATHWAECEALARRYPGCGSTPGSSTSTRATS